MSAERNLTEHDYELLSAYMDGMLEDGEREALEARLSADARLRRELAALRQTVALVQQLPTLKAPRDFTLSIPAAAPTVTRPPADATVTLAPTLLTRPNRTRRVIPLPLVSALSTAAAALLILAGVGLLLTNRADPPQTTQSIALQFTQPAPSLPEVAFTNAGELSTAERLTAAAPALAAPVPSPSPPGFLFSQVPPGGAGGGGGGGVTTGEGQAELETFGMPREGGEADALLIPAITDGAEVQTMPMISLTMTPAPTIGTVQELMQASAAALATTTQRPVPVPQSTSAPPPAAAMAQPEEAAAEATEAALMDAPTALAFALTATPAITSPPTATQTPSATPIPAATQEHTPRAAPQGTPAATRQTDAGLLLPLALIGAGVALLAGVIALNVRRRA